MYKSFSIIALLKLSKFQKCMHGLQYYLKTAFVRDAHWDRHLKQTQKFRD